LTLEDYGKLKKGFTRVYKRIRYLPCRLCEEYLSESKKEILISNFREYNHESEAMVAFIENYGPPTQLKIRKNFHELIGRELPHVKDDPCLLHYVPNDWDKQIHSELHLEKAKDTLVYLDAMEMKPKNLFDLEQRAITEKQNCNFRLLWVYRIWQEVGIAYNNYKGSIGRDLRFKKRSDIGAKFPMGDKEKFNDYELLDAVICGRTPQPGCNPGKTLPWLTVKPPPPNFVSLNMKFRIFIFKIIIK